MIKIIIPIVFFLISSCTKNGSIDHLYPSEDLVIENHDDWGEGNYRKVIKEFKSNPLNYGDIVFLGNSITQGGKNWSEKLDYPNIRNRGIDGDVIVARAFKPLEVILELIHSKGKNWRKIFFFCQVN